MLRPNVPWQPPADGEPQTPRTVGHTLDAMNAVEAMQPAIRQVHARIIDRAEHGEGLGLPTPSMFGGLVLSVSECLTQAADAQFGGVLDESLDQLTDAVLIILSQVNDVLTLKREAGDQ